MYVNGERAVHKEETYDQHRIFTSNVRSFGRKTGGKTGDKTAADDMQDMKDDMQDMKDEMRGMKDDIHELQRKVAGIGMHIENCTDKNVQLLAENFIELTKKLNMAIPAAHNNYTYEIKVNYLLEEVDKIKEIIKEKIA